VKRGDLVKYTGECEQYCACFFCSQNSNRLGIILEVWIGEDDHPCTIIEFDAGEWVLYGYEDRKCLEILGEA